MMNGKQLPLSGIAARTAVVHAVTYFTWGKIPLKSKVGLGGPQVVSVKWWKWLVIISGELHING